MSPILQSFISHTSLKLNGVILGLKVMFYKDLKLYLTNVVNIRDFVYIRSFTVR